jgi:hypothetical protein
MNKDPQNNHNLAETHPEIIEDFKAKIEGWKKKRS